MDILIPLLFIAIFYLGPVLLKNFLAKLNTQPDVEQLSYEMKNPPLKTKKQANMASDTELQSTMVADKMQSAPTVVQEQSPWRGKLDENMIINGVIFAEILQPPRAYRPFIKR